MKKVTGAEAPVTNSKPTESVPSVDGGVIVSRYRSNFKRKSDDHLGLLCPIV